MCTYIVLTLPPGADLDRVQYILARYGKEFQEFSNSHLARQLPRGTRMGTVTREMCDCGTAIGMAGVIRAEIRAANAELDCKFDRRVRDNQREEKLEKWVAHECKRIAAMERDAVDELRDGQAEAEPFVLMLRDMVNAGVSGVGLMVHQFSGLLAEEKFTIRTGGRKRVKAVTAEFLIGMEPDARYYFEA